MERKSLRGLPALQQRDVLARLIAAIRSPSLTATGGSAPNELLAEPMRAGRELECFNRTPETVTPLCRPARTPNSPPSPWRRLSGCIERYRFPLRAIFSPGE